MKQGERSKMNGYPESGDVPVRTVFKHYAGKRFGILLLRKWSSWVAWLWQWASGGVGYHSDRPPFDLQGVVMLEGGGEGEETREDRGMGGR